MKRAIAIILTMLLLSTCLPIQIFAQENVAPDTGNDSAAQVHKAYVTGMTDGSFSPTSSLTRAELAQMLYGVRAEWPEPETPEEPTEEPTEELTEELLEEPTEEPTEELPKEPTEDLTEEPAEELTEELIEEPTEEPTEEPFEGFTDVPDDAWYAKAVNALAQANILHGCGDGLFHPAQTASRAELVQVIVSVSGLKDASAGCTFTDLSETHWAYSSICIAAQKGWISGYTDGTCRPNNPVTRSEAVSLINRFLGRKADKAYIDAHPGTHFFPDVQPGNWCYYDIAEASITHTPTESWETWTDVAAQPLLLKDGFYIFGDAFLLVQDGAVVCSPADGTYQDVAYHCAETGVCTVELSDYSILQLANGLCLVKDGRLLAQRGYFERSGYLYYILSDGRLFCNGTIETMRFDANGRYTSGNRVIDSFVYTLVTSVTNTSMTQEQKLRACYSYVRDHIVYQSINTHVPRGAAESTWTESYMLRLIERGKGNCFCFASEMYYIARALGYSQARAISGGGSLNGNDYDHGWLEIKLDGVRYLFDPEVNWKYAKDDPYAYFKKQYGTTRFMYFLPF